MRNCAPVSARGQVWGMERMLTYDTALYLIGIGFGVVLLSDLIGNFIAFGNRLLNALVTGVVFSVIFTGILFYLIDVWKNDPNSGIPADADLTKQAILVILSGFGAVFVSDLIGNSIAFRSRFVNALVTATVFALAFGSVMYFGFLR